MTWNTPVKIKKRRIASITGTRAEYGLMTPVFKKIVNSRSLDLELIVTGMHLLTDFRSSLEKIQKDNICKLHYASMLLGENSGKAMAQALGLAVFGIASILEEIAPDIILLQGDRGEMLAGAIAASHMNIPVVHMSGGDYSGSIDDSIRNAISKFAHIHLTTCSESTKRLIAMGESKKRIFTVGEPGIDLIKNMNYIPAKTLALQLALDLSKPIILATQHPVTTEADQAGWQITQTLMALEELNLQTVFTYPNTDAGGREMINVIESRRNRSFLRIVPTLGSQKYLSLMRITSVMVGNSSSGILEAPSFKIPVVNIGTRQHGRLRAKNIIDVGYDKQQIKDSILFALKNVKFRKTLSKCKNPYGDGNTSQKTVQILTRLRITPMLLTKWMDAEDSFLSGD
jgi:UDP-N-acetylglucosamine 2-epimerase (non-hydrolysing)/GDP/UDP-N,N'-diacetylbacillosamine 2-epimerase (hydrolysing)